jgi:hypothetical protein
MLIDGLVAAALVMTAYLLLADFLEARSFRKDDHSLRE